MCCKDGHHYCGGRVELNTFTVRVGAEMFGLIMVGGGGSYSISKHLSESGYNAGFEENITLMHHLCPTSTG